jgi:hypothetical protein
MDGVCGSGLFSPGQIRKINACRLSMQVTLLSDMSTTCGRMIEPSYYKGLHLEQPNRPLL